MDKELLKQSYIKHFGECDNLHYSYCPYRICPLGAHVDHQKGIVSGFALNYGIGLVYSINEDGFCHFVSYNFEGKKRFNVNDFFEKQNDWADYLRGSLKMLQKEGYVLKNGITCYIYGELPVGGLSSSAAIIIAFLKAITEVNNINLDDKQLITYAYLCETEFVGLSIGKLDQSCEVLCKKDKLLVLDTMTDEYKLIEKKNNDVPYEFLIIHCGAERLLAGSAYNIRVDECKAAAFICDSYLNIDKKFKDTYLRNLDYNDFLKYKDKMPEKIMKRAMHFYNECERVKKGEEAWANGDIVEFGRLVSESGKSSIELYESGSTLLIDLYNIIKSTNGVYGGRFMGGGFNGACLAIIEPSKEKEIIENIRTKYINLHPEYKDKIGIFVCTSEDGVGA